MGCYYQHEDHLYVIEPESVFELILSIENALIEKHDYYWKISEIKTNMLLSPDRNMVVREETLVDPYCNICRDRLISISGGCQKCSFFPVCPIGSMNTDRLIDKLKAASYYEVDSTMFTIELHTLSNRDRNAF